MLKVSNEFDIGSVALHNLRLKLRPPVSPYTTSCDNSGGSFLSMLVKQQQGEVGHEISENNDTYGCQSENFGHSTADQNEALYAEWRAASAVFFGKVTCSDANAGPLVDMLVKTIKKDKDLICYCDNELSTEEVHTGEGCTGEGCTGEGCFSDYDHNMSVDVMDKKERQQLQYQSHILNNSDIIPNQPVKQKHSENPEEVSPLDSKSQNNNQLLYDNGRDDALDIEKFRTVQVDLEAFNLSQRRKEEDVKSILHNNGISLYETNNLLNSEAFGPYPNKHTSESLSHLTTEPTGDDANVRYVTVGVQCSHEEEAIKHLNEGNNNNHNNNNNNDVNNINNNNDVKRDKESSDERQQKYYYDASTAHLPTVELYDHNIDEIERRIKDEVHNAVRLQIAGAGFPIGLPNKTSQLFPIEGIGQECNASRRPHGVGNGSNSSPTCHSYNCNDNNNNNNIVKIVPNEGSYARDAEIAAVRDCMSRDLYGLRDQIAILKKEIFESSAHVMRDELRSHSSLRSPIMSRHHCSPASHSSKEGYHRSRHHRRQSVSRQSDSSYGPQSIRVIDSHLADCNTSKCSRCMKKCSTDRHRNITVKVVRDYDIPPQPYPKPKRKVNDNIMANANIAMRVDSDLKESLTSSIAYESDFTDLASDDNSISRVQGKRPSSVSDTFIGTSSSFRSVISSDYSTVYDSS